MIDTDATNGSGFEYVGGEWRPKTEQVDVARTLSCGTSQCRSHGSHELNCGGSTACMAIVGKCSMWTKPDATGDVEERSNDVCM